MLITDSMEPLLTRVAGNAISCTAQGKVRLDELAAGIHVISGSAAQPGGLVGQVHSGSLGQVDTLQQVNIRLGKIGDVTQRTAEAARENAVAGETLLNQSKAFQSTVRRITSFVGSSRSLTSGSSRGS